MLLLWYILLFNTIIIIFLIIISIIIIKIKTLTSAGFAEAASVVHVRDAVFAKVCVLLSHIKALYDNRLDFPVSFAARARPWTTNSPVVEVDSGNESFVAHTLADRYVEVCDE